MTPGQKLSIVQEYSDKILTIIDDDRNDNFTRSDLQGAVMAVVMGIISEK